MVSQFVSRARSQNLSIILVRVTPLRVLRFLIIWGFPIIHNSVGALIVFAFISLSVCAIESCWSLIVIFFRVVRHNLSNLPRRILLTGWCKIIWVKRPLFAGILKVLIGSLLVVSFGLLRIIRVMLWVEFLFFGLPKKGLIKLFVGNFHITQVWILALNSICCLPEHTFNFPDFFIWSWQ